MDFEEFNIPAEIRDLSLPNAAELNYWNLRKNRVFWVDFEIDEFYSLIELAKEIIRINIQEKDNKNPEPIIIYIHSYGGDLEQAFLFCDLCKTSYVPIVTVATGAAMSAGLLIFLSGHRRYAFPHAQLLIHSGSASFSGTAEQIEDAQKSYQKQIEQMKKYILSQSNITEQLYKKNKSRDWYVTGEDMVKLGLADKIVTNFSDIK